MGLNIPLLTQLAKAMAGQFGDRCEVVVHDLTNHSLNSSIVIIENGHISNRKIGDGPSHVVLEALHEDPSKINDHIGYITKTSDGHILKSSTIYIRDDDNSIIGILAINYDITEMMMIENAIHSLVSVQEQNPKPDKITHSVNELLDDLIEQSVALVGKPVALMTKDDKVSAIRFLNESGAFLITKSGDKVSKYFGISKYTLYSYIDINKNMKER